jgi:hypothetical protein
MKSKSEKKAGPLSEPYKPKVTPPPMAAKMKAKADRMKGGK